MRYIFSILLLLSITLSNAQSLKGKYISTFERIIFYEKEVTDPKGDGGMMVKLDTPIIDTITQYNLAILDFVSKSHVWIKYLGAAPEKGKYHLRNNKLKIKTENDKIHGKYISNDSLVIIINDGKSLVQLIFSEQNIEELKTVTSRPKFEKYFDKNDIADLIDLINIIGKIEKITKEPEICRDPKDNFLLALSDKGKIDYLVTGDSDLLTIGEYKKL